MLESLNTGQHPNQVWPFVSSNPAELLEARIHPLLREQEQLRDETQRAAIRWLKRRQEAMEEGLSAFEAVSTSRDPDSVSEAYQQWLTGSVNRIAADLSDAREEAALLGKVWRECVMALLGFGLEAIAPASETAAKPQIGSDRSQGSPERLAASVEAAAKPQTIEASDRSQVLPEGIASSVEAAAKLQTNAGADQSRPSPESSAAGEVAEGRTQAADERRRPPTVSKARRPGKLSPS